MWKYRTAIYLLAALTVYMLVCAIICSVKAFQQIDNPMYARMLVSLLATYGVYVFASFIAMDPLHLLTSAGQYFLLQASEPDTTSVCKGHKLMSLHRSSISQCRKHCLSETFGQAYSLAGLT